MSDERSQPWGPIFRSSPLLERLGGFMSKGQGSSLEVGLQVQAHHLNSRGTLHGGALCTLADAAFGYLVAFSTDPPRRLVTQALNIEFLAPVVEGEFLEAVVLQTSRHERGWVADGELRRAGVRVAAVKVIFHVPS